MMKIFIWIFFWSCFSVVLTSQVNVTKCYSCNASLPNACPNPLHTIDCHRDEDDDEFTCVNVDFGGSLYKGCLPLTKEAKSTCEKFIEIGGKCDFCDFDLCNSNQTISETQSPFFYCYRCEKICDDKIATESCYDVLYDANYSCIHMDIKGAVTKKCVETSEARDMCEDVKRKSGKCYFCEEPYCNENPKVSETKGVSQCYLCNKECKKPLEIQKCNDEMYSACLHMEAYGDIIKNCIYPHNFTCPDDDIGRCHICYTDLCNNDTKKYQSQTTENFEYAPTLIQIHGLGRLFSNGNNASTKIIFQIIVQLIIFVLFG